MMDHFERELARMMRDAQEHTPFEGEHQARLRNGVRARRRVRVVQKALGSGLVVAGFGIGFLLLPHGPAENRPQAPLPRPAMSPASPSPTSSPTWTPTSSPTGGPDGSPTGTTESASPPPTATGSSITGSSDPTPTRTETAPPSDTGTPTAPTTPSSTPSTEETATGH